MLLLHILLLTVLAFVIPAHGDHGWGWTSGWSSGWGWPSKSKFEQSQVIPDVIDRDPQNILHVTYNNSMTVKEGNSLTPTQVSNPPTVSWPADSKKLYTLIMVDPDAPSRKNHTMREYRHWLVVNIPGHNVSQGDTCSDYYPSEPPQDGGVHRYVLAVYQQPGRITVDPNLCAQEDMDRQGFKTKKFVKTYKLETLIAANYFNSQYDGSY